MLSMEMEMRNQNAKQAPMGRGRKFILIKLSFCYTNCSSSLTEQQDSSSGSRLV